MKGKQPRKKVSGLKSGSAEMKINQNLHAGATALRNAPFYKEKMAKGEEILLRVGLPKEI